VRDGFASASPLGQSLNLSLAVDPVGQVPQFTRNGIV
jgi:hypothetical protein